ncbi:hypothetical protein E2C01_046557 [Portunus trituberculatus]|uniref:Uncharacterized protein n=1 Tax=Portunus trituberculatus TaxID=210409 RepID=A0A5B7FYW8_PORTR|nr:hypothetical protein [Portunus trituberculatus]
MTVEMVPWLKKNDRSPWLGEGKLVCQASPYTDQSDHVTHTTGIGTQHKALMESSKFRGLVGFSQHI